MSRIAIRLIFALALVAAVALPRDALAQRPGEPRLVMGAPVAKDGSVTVPISFTANGAQVANVVFAVAYDAARLTIDPTDADQDGVADAVVTQLPAAIQPMISLDAARSTIDVVLAAAKPPLPALPDGRIMTIAFRPQAADLDLGGAVRFASSPVPSFGGTEGKAVPGTAIDSTTVQPAPSGMTLGPVEMAIPAAVILILLAWWWRRATPKPSEDAAASS